MNLEILDLPIDIWIKVLLIGFVIIIICCIVTAATTYSMSVKITEIMRDTIKISEHDDSDVRDNVEIN